MRMSSLLFSYLIAALLGCSSDDGPGPKSVTPQKPVDKNWEFETTPVWSDEFDYDGLPTPSKWDYDIGGHGWGNNELQYYIRSEEHTAELQSSENLVCRVLLGNKNAD